MVSKDKIAFDVTDDTEYTFTFATKEIATDATPAASKVGEVTKVDANNRIASVVATATDATEYGILVAVKPAEGNYDFAAAVPDVATLETLTEGDTENQEIIRLPALGATAEGQFVIQIDDTSERFFVSGTVYEAKVYALANGKLDLSDDSFDLN